jgi:hypothetical protein
MKLLLTLITVAALAVEAQMPPMPPVVTNRVAILHPPRNQKPPSVPCINLAWQSYTDAWFEIDGFTNLLSATNCATPDWATNVPIACTNVWVPELYSNEFFRIKTMYRVTQP